MGQPAKGPLNGMIVADFSHNVAGPYCTMYLADLGARVVKIEQPGRGDAARYMSISERFEAGIPVDGGDYFLSINRNKDSAAIDLKTERGRQLALDLIQRADVLVENFSAGVMERLGLGYERVKDANPGLVYCSITAYGTEGELGGEPGMDVAVQARSGVMSIVGEPGGSPMKAGASLADLAGGLNAATGVLAALLARVRNGGGQRVDVSLLDATVGMLINYSVPVIDGGVDIQPVGSGHPQLVPFQAFPSLDGWIVVAAGTNSRWRRLCEALERPDLADDERYRTNPGRVRNRDHLVPELERTLQTKTTAEWLSLFTVNGVPSAPVLTLREAFAQPQLVGRNILRSVPHSTYGALTALVNPIQLSLTPARVDQPPPRLGEHTRDVVIGLLGRTEAEYEQLATEGVVADPPAGDHDE